MGHSDHLASQKETIILTLCLIWHLFCFHQAFNYLLIGSLSDCYPSAPQSLTWWLYDSEHSTNVKEKNGLQTSNPPSPPCPFAGIFIADQLKGGVSTGWQTSAFLPWWAPAMHQAPLIPHNNPLRQVLVCSCTTDEEGKAQRSIKTKQQHLSSKGRIWTQIIAIPRSTPSDNSYITSMGPIKTPLDRWRKRSEFGKHPKSLSQLQKKQIHNYIRSTTDSVLNPLLNFRVQLKCKNDNNVLKKKVYHWLCASLC